MKPHHIITFIFILNISSCEKKMPRIAIVGAGIGGASSAHFLRQLLPTAEIHVYESSQRIGGRLRTVSLAQRSYEIGGSIIHPRNFYMSSFTRLHGLKQQTAGPSIFGLNNGSKFVFEESTWDFITLLKLAWRYGWMSLYLLRGVLDAMLDNFSRIYKAQEDGLAFTNVTMLLSYMDLAFPFLTQKSFKEHLLKERFSERFIEELAQAICLVNYGQSVNDLSAFVGMVSLAGAEPGLWAVQGGNKLVPEKLLYNSSIVHLGTSVAEVSLLRNGSFSLLLNKGSEGASLTEGFDIVIIATPLNSGISKIKFTGFPSKIGPFPGRYHLTVATLIHGELNYTHFGLEANSPLTSIFYINPNFKITSIGHLYPVDYKLGEQVPNVWKIFSSHDLSSNELSTLFSRIKDVQKVDWFAYPHYSPFEPLPSFVLHPNLYYTNAIEWAASAMEMSAIAGRNAALLAFNLWSERHDHLDQLPIKIHKEL